MRKVFFIRERIVKLPAQLELISLHEHHEGENTTQREYVNRQIWIYFRMSASKCHANFIFDVLP
jgi:hypothetical protein